MAGTCRTFWENKCVQNTNPKADNVGRKDKVDPLPKHHARKTYIELDKKFLGVMLGKVVNPDPFTLGMNPQLARYHR
jgi:hypothetical protein